MKKSASGFITYSLLGLMGLSGLCGCSYFSSGARPGGEVVTYYPKPVSEHKEFTLFELGRTLSHNAVDIIDPALSIYTIPPDAPEFANPLAKFSFNPNMLIRDDSVEVFALVDPSPLDVIDNVGEPVPLVQDGSPLPP